MQRAADRRESGGREAAPRDSRPFAVAAALDGGGQLDALTLEALAGQIGTGQGRVPVFAAVTDWKRAARMVLDMSEGRMDLRLIRCSSAGSRDPVAAALEAAAAHLARLSPRSEPALLLTRSGARPAPDWIANSIAALDDGADLVCSTLVPMEMAPVSPDGARLARIAADVARYRRLLADLEAAIDPVPWDPAPRHGDESGYGLALTLSAHRRAGGAPDLSWFGDRHLIRRLVLSGAAIRHDPRARVFLASSLCLGAALRPGAEPEPPEFVPDPEMYARLCRERARTRRRLAADVADLAEPERSRTLRATLELAIASPGAGLRSLPLREALRRFRRASSPPALPPRLPMAEPLRADRPEPGDRPVG